MTKKRTGEKVGWIGGWAGSFLWVLILSIVMFYQKRALEGVVGIVLIIVDIAAVLYFAPWRHRSTPYWRLMIVPYSLFFIAFVWAYWAFGGLESLGFNWWNLLWLLPALSPFGMLGNKKWEDQDSQSRATTDSDFS